jgi:Asp-tRNA(Asn)/Glu-tRNA(Gln) amidotransferase C subunit
LQQFQNGLEHYQQSEYDKAFAIFSNLSCKNNLEECAILKHNSANSMVMMSENFSTETVEQALDVYKKSLILREDPDTRWNYEKVKEFLSKKTKE